MPDQSNLENYDIWTIQKRNLHDILFMSKELFSVLDDQMNPEAFLLGFKLDDNGISKGVNLEQKDQKFDVESFNNLANLLSEFQKNTSCQKTLLKPPHFYSQKYLFEVYKHLSDSILEVFKTNDKERNYYVAVPAITENYLIFTVLSLQTACVDKYYTLTKKMRGHKYFEVSRSFLESVITVFLNGCSSALFDSKRRLGTMLPSGPEILRLAGLRFMHAIAAAGEDDVAFYGLYNACNKIASMKYEGANSIGKMIVAPRNHKNIKYTLKLKKPIEIWQTRRTRKFLEISNEHTSIISDSSYIYGLGEITGNYNHREESIFTISFLGHHKWEVQHDRNALMVVEYNVPSLPKERIEKNVFEAFVSTQFNGIESAQIQYLWEIVTEATNQEHGTMIVVSKNAKSEAERLGNQCFTMYPMRLSLKIVQSVTSIDGAVLIDTDSVCHAIGVILDGIATPEGNSARGSRYNSALRYYEYYKDKHELAMIVISEDGMINLIPNPSID